MDCSNQRADGGARYPRLRKGGPAISCARGQFSGENPPRRPRVMETRRAVITGVSPATATPRSGPPSGRPGPTRTARASTSTAMRSRSPAGSSCGSSSPGPRRAPHDPPPQQRRAQAPRHPASDFLADWPSGHRNRLSPAVAEIARNCQGWALPLGLCRTIPAHFLHGGMDLSFLPRNQMTGKVRSFRRDERGLFWAMGP